MTGKDLNIKKIVTHYLKCFQINSFCLFGHLTFSLSFAWFCNLQSETLYQDNCNHELKSGLKPHLLI